MKTSSNYIQTERLVSKYFSSSSSQPNTKNTNSVINESQHMSSKFDPMPSLESMKSTPTPSRDQAESSYEDTLLSFKKLCLQYEYRKEKSEQKSEQKLDKKSQSDFDSNSDQVVSFDEDEDEDEDGYQNLIPLEFSEEQRKVLDLIFEQKKNVFFTGSAGTGKSLIIREIINIANNIRFTGRANKLFYNGRTKYVAVTALTGLAAFQLGGSTLHSFAGIGLGTNTAEELAKKISKNDRKLEKWRNVELLIIDEISMLDAELFDKLEFIARKVRKCSAPFGGIQLVVSGDFFQLPPVQQDKNMKFAFEASTWNKCIQETVVLHQVYRQKDPEFSRILNEARIGNLTQSSINIFRSLSRPLSMEDGLQPTQLFPTRKEVDNFNSHELDLLPGPIYQYTTRDYGTEQFVEQLNKVCMLPEVLELKVGAQVMLLKNISAELGLVNGLIGKIVRFVRLNSYHVKNRTSKRYFDYKRLYPMVKFKNGYKYVCAPEEVIWEVDGKELATRIQVPLTLSWALSIHKAQGQTLQKVKIDFAKIFEKGQAYVAMSRCTTLEGLQILNFSHLKVQAHPRVIQYYAKYQI